MSKRKKQSSNLNKQSKVKKRNYTARRLFEK